MNAQFSAAVYTTIIQTITKIICFNWFHHCTLGENSMLGQQKILYTIPYYLQLRKRAFHFCHIKAWKNIQMTFNYPYFI